jgi:hypothetical protein
MSVHFLCRLKVLVVEISLVNNEMKMKLLLKKVMPFSWQYAIHTRHSIV